MKQNDKKVTYNFETQFSKGFIALYIWNEIPPDIQKELINALNEKLKPHFKKNESIRNAWIVDNGHMKIRTVIDFEWKRKNISKTTEIFARMARNAVEAKYNELKNPFDKWSVRE